MIHYNNQRNKTKQSDDVKQNTVIYLHLNFVGLNPARIHGGRIHASKKLSGNLIQCQWFYFWCQLVSLRMQGVAPEVLLIEWFMAGLWPLIIKKQVFLVSARSIVFSIISWEFLLPPHFRKHTNIHTSKVTLPTNCPVTPQYNCLIGYQHATHVITDHSFNWFYTCIFFFLYFVMPPPLEGTFRFALVR